MNSQRACWIVMMGGALLLAWSMEGVAVSHVLGIAVGGAIIAGASQRLRQLGYKSWWERRRERLSASRPSAA